MSGLAGPLPLFKVMSWFHALGSPQHAQRPPLLPPPLPPQPETAERTSARMSIPSIDMFTNAVYYPNWHVRQGKPPSSLRLSLISHVFYAHGLLAADGSVSLSDPLADTAMEVDGQPGGCLGSFAALKRQHRHLKLLLSVGGGEGLSQNFAAVASSPQTLQTFGMTARELLHKYGFDGIDVNWEHPADQTEGHNYVCLLHVLRDFLPAPRYLVTSALPAAEWGLRHINLELAQHYLDLVNVMAYDFAGPWTAESGHHAQLYSPALPHNDAARVSCQSAVDYFIARKVPPGKIVLGIPVYGRSFLGVICVGRSFTGTATFAYSLLPPGDCTEQVDRGLGAAFCINAEKGWVTYDNPETVRMKAKFVVERKLKGLFYWTGTGDAEDGERSLVQAGFSALHCAMQGIEEAPSVTTDYSALHEEYPDLIDHSNCTQDAPLEPHGEM
ncbi:MAG: hypothetical protein M1832_001847 [Thelocarpon impressellum]|nr:MAG: hypothetical protein M1832_001847 [Thelocarpon impressellum]